MEGVTTPYLLIRDVQYRKGILLATVMVYTHKLTNACLTAVLKARAKDQLANAKFLSALHRLSNENLLFQVVKTGTHMPFSAGIPKLGFLLRHFPNPGEFGLF